MTQLRKIHPDYNVYFETLGNTVQSRVTIIRTLTYTHESPLQLIEPGRTILIGNVANELRKIFNQYGKPKLNTLTGTDERPGGIFSSASYAALLNYLYDDTDPERQTPRLHGKRAAPAFEPAIRRYRDHEKSREIEASTLIG